MENQMQFRISSALKNLIGKELITDEFVAVFELVKNSFDANAKHVKVVFENQYNPELAKIIIWDDGRGMSFDDLKNKWLFVAYSAKKDGTEDKDYRDKIKTKRIFAGAKGVGRFSCDRLGDHLNMITLKDEPNSKIENLVVDWTDFEEDSNKEFVDVKVFHSVLDSISYKDFKQGTILEITGLRDVWDRSRIKRLKFSLEKLINPIQENDIENFDIEIIAFDELVQDKNEKIERNKLNGKIKNFIFETLGLKTTQIKVEIIENGGVVKTTLTDRGKEIYWIKERNHYPLLSDIKINLFVLNFEAKINFKKQMDIRSVDYGSVFIYKNGFRIYPFGEEGDDTLLIDRRKQQGYNRFLGTRDLIGRIEISGEQSNLKETTSRDGGFIKNDSYYELVELFYDKALKRLEKYTVDIIKWGDERKDKDTGEISPSLNPEDVRAEILEIISTLTKAKEVIDIGYDVDFLKIYEAKQEKSVSQIVKNFNRIAQETRNPELVKQAKAAEKQVKELIEAKIEAEKENESTKANKKAIEEKLDQKAKQVLFLQSVENQDINRIVRYHHDIGVHSSTVNNWLNKIAKEIDKKTIDEDKLKKFIEAVSRANNKILSISRFATKANFNLSGQELRDTDFISFIDQYSENVLREFYPDIKVHFKNKSDSDFVIPFKPLEVSLMFDNIVDNSIKANANNIFIDVFNININTLGINIRDDGKGLSNKLEANSVFEKGVTTTSGSGLGLYNVANTVLKELKGLISVNSQNKKGFELNIQLKK